MFSPSLAYNEKIEALRDEEYPALKGKTYLDHGGTTLYAKSLIEQISADLITNLYGNPHSESTPSALAGQRVDNIRFKTLRFFNADPEHFDLVFVANATAAIKLVVEAFRDSTTISGSNKGKHRSGFWYGYHRDAHSSLVGVREATAGFHHCFQSDLEVEEWIQSAPSKEEKNRACLFAYPGQSNMTGRRLPLTWPSMIRQNHQRSNTYVLFDAAALATSTPLDFSNESAAPDFTTVSFYKIFGYPDLGALIVRKSAGSILQQRKYFGGGTVDMVISINDSWHMKKDYSLHDQLEDGTLPFHSIFALDAAMDVHQRLFGSMKDISAHTAFLAHCLYNGLASIRHHNGIPLCCIYKDSSATYGDPSTQGATIAFNLQRPDGSLISYTNVDRQADKQGIYLRSGGLCNPGGVATYLQWTPQEMKAAYEAGHRCSHPTEIMQGKATGLVRASLGAMSTIRDVNVLIMFLRETFISAVDPLAFLKASTNFDERFNLGWTFDSGRLETKSLSYVNTDKPGLGHRWNFGIRRFVKGHGRNRTVPDVTYV